MDVKIWILVAVAAGALYLLSARRGGDSVETIKRLVEQGALLVDVRTPGEYAGGHLTGALNLPLQQLETRLGELGEKDRPIVLYCRSGNRSGQARRLLEQAGYQNVHDLGAMSRW